MRIALINPNTSTAATEMMVAIAADAAPRNWIVTGHTAPFGPRLITTPEALAEAATAVAALAPNLPPRDGVIVAAFGDPGAETLRETLTQPVVGLAEAAMAAAARHGRFAVATTTPQLATSITALAASYGHGAAFAGVHLTEGDPHTLMADPDALTDALHRTVEAAVREDGADAVIIGGGPLAAAARQLAASAPVPLVEPIPAAVRALVAISGGMAP